MTPHLPRLALAGSCTSLGVSACCVLPTALVLLGGGGSWLGIFARIAAVGYFVAAAASLLVAVAWVVAARQGALGRHRLSLGFGTALTAVAWIVLLNEIRLNDALIGLM